MRFSELSSLCSLYSELSTRCFYTYPVWSVRPQTQPSGPVKRRGEGGQLERSTGGGVPRPKARQGHSRFGDTDVVWRALKAQAAEATPDIMAGLGLRAVVSAERTLVQVWGKKRKVRMGTPPGLGGIRPNHRDPPWRPGSQGSSFLQARSFHTALLHTHPLCPLHTAAEGLAFK